MSMHEYTLTNPDTQRTLMDAINATHIGNATLNLVGLKVLDEVSARRRQEPTQNKSFSMRVTMIGTDEPPYVAGYDTANPGTIMRVDVTLGDSAIDPDQRPLTLTVLPAE